MAISLIQTATGDSGFYTTSGTVTLGSNVTAGNTLFLTVTNGSANTYTVADNRSNTWVKITEATGERRTELWIVKVANAGSTTVTITINSGADTALILREYSGLTSDPYDVSAIGSNPTSYVQTHSSAATATTAQANELVLCVGGGTDSNPTYAAGSGYGNLISKGGQDLYTSSVMTDKIVSATGTQTGTFTTTAFMRGETIVATFKEASLTNTSRFFQLF